MKKTGLFILFSILISFHSLSQVGQKESRKEIRREKADKLAIEIHQMAESRSLVFVASEAHPMGGGVIHLTSPYDLKIKGDSVFAYLPYYGVAYHAEYGSSEGGIKFREPAREYRSLFAKSVYEISFKVKSPVDFYTLKLSFSRTGYGTLGVTSNNRQFISFSGRVESPEEEGKSGK